MANPKTVITPLGSFFKRRRSIVIGSLVLIVAALAIAGDVTLGFDEHRPLTLWQAAAHDVEVKIYILKDPSGQLRLTGSFKPTRPGFSLYSKDLPKNGLQGLGRPTLLEVNRSGSIMITGALEADQPVQNIYVNALGLTFPVYPAGPVELSLPFKLTGKSAFMELSITYMACSDSTCLAPVIDKHASIQIPDRYFDG